MADLIEIKSIFILKKIFSYLISKQKLIIINYNMYLQRKLNVDIEDFKKECNKYKAKLQSNLDSDANRFASMQNKNAGLFFPMY